MYFSDRLMASITNIRPQGHKPLNTRTTGTLSITSEIVQYKLIFGVISSRSGVCLFSMDDLRLLNQFIIQIMEPTEQCSNCRIQIPESKHALHEMYCQRNNIQCKRCLHFYDKNDPESHEEEYHGKEQCPHCKQEFADLKQHNCSQKPVTCIHCKLDQPKDLIYQHENQCGARTSKCQTCFKPIMLRDLAKHESTCVMPSIQEPIQKLPSREVYDKPVDKPYLDPSNRYQIPAQPQQRSDVNKPDYKLDRPIQQQPIQQAQRKPEVVQPQKQEPKTYKYEPQLPSRQQAQVPPQKPTTAQTKAQEKPVVRTVETKQYGNLDRAFDRQLPAEQQPYAPQSRFQVQQSQPLNTYAQRQPAAVIQRQNSGTRQAGQNEIKDYRAQQTRNNEGSQSNFDKNYDQQKYQRDQQLQQEKLRNQQVKNQPPVKEKPKIFEQAPQRNPQMRPESAINRDAALQLEAQDLGLTVEELIEQREYLQEQERRQKEKAAKRDFNYQDYIGGDDDEDLQKAILASQYGDK